ncbi:MAG: hypothetical protein QNJ73_07705 [Gammaproteobacteria bacterium]|nr:hypothetical protein [Gammaproteobacteria bacterium]
MAETPSKLVLSAIGLFSLSLALRFFGEIAWFVAAVDAGGDPAFLGGRVSVPIAYYAFQVFLLFRIYRLRNWARITLAIVVLLNCLTAFILLSSPIATVFGSPIAAAVPVLLEVVAVLLLFSSSGFSQAKTYAT